MIHSFDIEIAKKYGINEALIYNHFLFWIIKNKANEKNYKDGRYWTYSSIKALQNIFDYLSEKQIRTAINNLIDNKVLIKANYNSNPYDRTTWYAFVEEPYELSKISNTEGQKEEPKNENPNADFDKSICPKGTFDLPQRENHYTDILTYRLTNKLTDGGKENPPPPPSSDFDLFSKHLVAVFTRLTAKTALSLCQLDSFKTFEKREELQELFENRRFDWEGCVKYAENECQKAQISKRWLEFLSILRLVLRDGAEGIKRQLTAEELAKKEELEKIKQAEMEELTKKQAEEERVEREKYRRIQLERDKQEAEKLGISLEEYQEQRKIEEDAYFRDLKAGLCN